MDVTSFYDYRDVEKCSLFYECLGVWELFIAKLGKPNGYQTLRQDNNFYIEFSETGYAEIVLHEGMYKTGYCIKDDIISFCHHDLDTLRIRKKGNYLFLDNYLDDELIFKKI